MNELTVWDQWAASYCMTVGCNLVRVLEAPDSQYLTYIFDDANGATTRALSEWRAGNSFVRTRDFIKAYKTIRQISRRVTAQIVNGVTDGFANTRG